MAIVSCPECKKKLKIADTSVGKKVKCSCGHVFVAPAIEAAAVTPAPAAADKVYVACTECQAKLKVATTSLGKKMKCPKCAAVFVANVEEEPPAGMGPPPPAEEELMPKVPAKMSKQDEEDLLSFAEEDAKGKDSGVDLESVYDDDDDMPKSKGKAKPKVMDDDDDDMPQAKLGKKPPAMRKDDEKPIYPSRLLPNLMVTVLLLGYMGAFAFVFFFTHLFDPGETLGLPVNKGLRAIKGQLPDADKDKNKGGIVPDDKDKDGKEADKGKNGDKGKDKDAEKDKNGKDADKGKDLDKDKGGNGNVKAKLPDGANETTKKKVEPVLDLKALGTPVADAKTVVGDWDFTLGENKLRMTFTDDGKLSWKRAGSGTTLLPLWLFYGNWKVEGGKLTIHGNYQGRDGSVSWTAFSANDGNTLNLLAGKSVTVMVRPGKSN